MGFTREQSTLLTKYLEAIFAENVFYEKYENATGYPENEAQAIKNDIKNAVKELKKVFSEKEVKFFTSVAYGRNKDPNGTPGEAQSSDIKRSQTRMTEDEFRFLSGNVNFEFHYTRAIEKFREKCTKPLVSGPSGWVKVDKGLTQKQKETAMAEYADKYLR